MSAQAQLARHEILLSLENIHKSYNGIEALSGISAQIRNLQCSANSRIVGQVVAFLGPSGAGKTVLSRIIAGLEPPDSGGVFIDPDRKPIQKGMAGMVFQKYPLFMHRTVMGNLAMAGQLGGMSTGVAWGRARDYLHLFELDGAGDKYPAELSGGMQQRVAICQQLMNMDGPKSTSTHLMLMDEPFAALDDRNTRKTCRLIRKVADMNDHNTIVVVTHDITAALSIGDTVWIMGRDRDANGKVCSGGKIVKELDMASVGLAWDEDIHRRPELYEYRREIAAMFDNL